jgi:hypothetical protein
VSAKKRAPRNRTWDAPIRGMRFNHSDDSVQFVGMHTSRYSVWVIWIK